MSEGLETAVRAALIGAGATLVLDIWNAVLKHFLGIPSLNLGMLGRWFGHFPRGRFIHDNIAEASAVPAERIIGWIAHYAIGITWAALLLVVWGLDWARHSTPLPALIVGLVTLVAPFFIMQPGMGNGVLASKTPRPHVVRLKSISSHAVYGVGLYGAALLSTLLMRT